MRRPSPLLRHRQAGLLAAAAALVVALVPVTARLAIGEPPDAGVPGLEHDRPGLLDVDPAGLDARLQDVRAVLELEQEQLEPLRTAFRKATDPQAAEEIATRIRELKTATEFAVLQVQLGHAREDGDPDRVATLESLLALTSGAPVSRDTTSLQRNRRGVGQ